MFVCFCSSLVHANGIFVAAVHVESSKINSMQSGNPIRLKFHSRRWKRRTEKRNRFVACLDIVPLQNTPNSIGVEMKMRRKMFALNKAQKFAVEWARRWCFNCMSRCGVCVSVRRLIWLCNLFIYLFRFCFIPVAMSLTVTFFRS